MPDPKQTKCAVRCYTATCPKVPVRAFAVAFGGRECRELAPNPAYVPATDVASCKMHYEYMNCHLTWIKYLFVLQPYR